MKYVSHLELAMQGAHFARKNIKMTCYAQVLLYCPWNAPMSGPLPLCSGACTAKGPAPGPATAPPEPSVQEARTLMPLETWSVSPTTWASRLAPTPAGVGALHHPHPGAHVLQAAGDVQGHAAAARHQDAGVVRVQPCARRRRRPPAGASVYSVKLKASCRMSKCETWREHSNAPRTAATESVPLGARASVQPGSIAHVSHSCK